MKSLRVRARDGSLAPFDPSRIEADVLAAQERAGRPDRGAAADAAELVQRALERRATQGVADVDLVGELVEEVLVELGQAGAARSYILERARTARARSASAGGGAGTPTGNAQPGTASARAPLVTGAHGVEPWSRARITAALVAEAELPRALAEEVALRVEERVLESGLRRLTPALVRELVDNELVERGLSQALRRARAVGLPRHDLARWIAAPIAAGAGAEQSLERRVSGAILRRFALEDTLSVPLAESLAGGDFGLLDLARPHLDLALALPLEVLAARAGASAPWDALDECARACGLVARALVLEDCGPLLASLSRGPGAEERLEGWLRALGALGKGAGVSIDLAPRLATRAAAPAARSAIPAWLERVILTLAALEDGPSRAALPRLVLPGGELARALAVGEHARADSSSEAAQRAAETLLARGRIVPTLDSETHALGAGLMRAPRERGALSLRAAVALNLPRAARRAGPWREDALFAELVGTLSQALEAARELAELPRASNPAPWRATSAIAVVPCGLREALLWMGDGAARPETAARLLAFLSEAAQRLARERGLAAHVSLTDVGAEGARLATLDANRFRARQARLFDAAEAGAGAEPYSGAFELPWPPAASSDRVGCAAEALAALPCVALEDPSFLAALALGRTDRAPRLAALGELERARERRRSLASTLYLIPGHVVPAGRPLFEADATLASTEG